MTDIVTEVESLRDFIADPMFTKYWMQHLPSKYTAGELSVRFIGDTATSETGYHTRFDREYQFVIFGTSERDCIVRASAVQRKLNNVHVIPLKGTSRFIRNGLFALSQPFKTEGGEVFAVIGVLQAEIREARHFEVSPKITGIDAEITD